MVMKEAPFAGGKSLRYTWDNMELLMDTLGFETLVDFVNFIPERKYGLKHIRIIVWAGLQREGETIDLKDVGKIIDEYLKDHNFEDLLSTTMGAVINAWGDEGEAQGENQKKTPKPSKNS
jgi:hypothetical protein